ncbi:MAG: hypothetical protein HYR94_20835 [Chloroflexi bacterium]|nr:hypothetical protein [Chloroflexota bacterium]
MIGLLISGSQQQMMKKPAKNDVFILSWLWPYDNEFLALSFLMNEVTSVEIIMPSCTC